MLYEWSQSQSGIYATALRLDTNTGRLDWSAPAGQDTLIVQTPFGTKVAQQLRDKIVPALNETPLKRGFTEILPRVYVRYVTAGDHQRIGGCEPNGQACIYTVYPAQKRDEDTIVVFDQTSSSGMLSNTCSVPLEVQAHVEKEMREEDSVAGKISRLFTKTRQQMVFTGFYKLTFKGDFDKSYKGGDISYKVGDFEVPLSLEAISVDCLYVKSNIPPTVQANNEGIRLV